MAESDDVCDEAALRPLSRGSVDLSTAVHVVGVREPEKGAYLEEEEEEEEGGVEPTSFHVPRQDARKESGNGHRKLDNIKRGFVRIERIDDG